MIKFYRCMGCTAVVAPWDVKETGGCRKCGGGRLRLTNLSWWEKLVQMIRRPAIWRWSDV